MMRVNQHLMCLQWIGADDEGPAVAELAMRNLQLGPGAANDGEILAPVELEGFTRPERQRHEGASAGGPLNPLALLLPSTGKGRDPVVGAVIAKADQVTIQLLD